MVGGLVLVTDETTFYRYLGAAIDPLFRQGRPSADEVLLRVLAERFPDVAWPPEEGTTAAAQWDFMLDRVSAILERYTPTPTPRLRVVK